ncbi:MAG: protein kinase [Myxococcales bacterium]|nr:protein kinase [Myxococcales bacterium]
MSGGRRNLEVTAPSRPATPVSPAIGRPSPSLEQTAPSRSRQRSVSVGASSDGDDRGEVDLEATAPSNAALRRSQVASEGPRDGDTLHAPAAPAQPRSADAPEDRTLVAGSEVNLPVLLPRRVGRFAILRALGSGGMGSVYAAFDEELARRVAIKVLHVAETMPAAARELLLAEAQAMARLSHPNVVQVYELGEQGGQIFLVMEFIAGETLGEWLRPPRPWTEVLTMLLAAGL